MFKVFFALFILFIFSCQRNNNPISSDNTEIFFPTTIGSSWNYSFVDTTFFIFYPDSFIVKTDTIHLEIVSNHLQSNSKREIIGLLGSGNSIDSLFLNYSSDTLFFYTKNSSKYFTSELVLIFPLKEGKKWKYRPFDYEVSTIDSLKLPFGSLKDVFVVKQLLKRVGNSGGENIYYIKPGIGIVKFVYRLWTTMRDTNYRKIWQLINYSESK